MAINVTKSLVELCKEIPHFNKVYKNLNDEQKDELFEAFFPEGANPMIQQVREFNPVTQVLIKKLKEFMDVDIDDVFHITPW